MNLVLIAYILWWPKRRDLSRIAKSSDVNTSVAIHKGSNKFERVLEDCKESSGKEIGETNRTDC